MKVRKENRVLSVSDADKTFYLSEGYDVVELADDEKAYKVVESATGGRTYSIAEYQDVVAERDKALAEIKALKGQLETADPKKFDREAVKAILAERGVTFSGNASNDTLKQLLEDSE